jgi:hypothetical protein
MQIVQFDANGLSTISPKLNKRITIQDQTTVILHCTCTRLNTLIDHSLPEDSEGRVALCIGMPEDLL